MNKYTHILAKGAPNPISLKQHLLETAEVAMKAAKYWNLDCIIAKNGAFVHDIGKVSPIFQRSLKDISPSRPFRHEIASMFFLSLFQESYQYRIIEMVIGHHKSIYDDSRKLGILDLEDSNEDVFEYHATNFIEWVDDALGILDDLGIKTHSITYNEARENYFKVIDYCESTRYGWSIWKGLLIGADHYASAIPGKIQESLKLSFRRPNLTFYHNLVTEKYPLSLIDANSSKRHTLLQAPTGSGKTNFLLRRCKGRVFYLLPYQASINAMYQRIKKDLGRDGGDIRLLHATSRILLKGNQMEEKFLQDKIGSSIKILTPHQIAGIVFAIKGYESMILDIKGCDVILDEIHTYSDISQAIVLKMIEILHALNCHIHIGTATMPTVLYQKIIDLLDREDVCQVSLPNDVLRGYDRHHIIKLDDKNKIWNVIYSGIERDQKILIVCNQVGRAQDLFREITERFPECPKMLIHSRFRRKDRSCLENSLMEDYNTTDRTCIVVSTQVVEVSLDISFDIMITEAAPLDSLIQRFGRINRKRPWGEKDVKPIYVLPPKNSENESKPYTKEVIDKSFQLLPDNDILREVHIQEKLDTVYPDIEFLNIDLSANFEKGKWKLKELWHRPKSALIDLIDIDSATCITNEDRELYLNSIRQDDRLELEVPVHFQSLAWRGLERLNCGTCPFILPDVAYDSDLGLLMGKAKPENYSTIFL